MPIPEKTKYELKIEDLNRQVNEKARELQKENEKLDSSREEQRALQESKRKLRATNAALVESGRELQAIIESKTEGLEQKVSSKKKQEKGLNNAIVYLRSSLVQLGKVFTKTEKEDEKLKALHTKRIMWAETLENTKKQVVESQNRVKFNNEKAEKVQKEAKRQVDKALDLSESIGRQVKCMDEWYKKLKFYARRLKKHFMAHKLPFPEELSDLRHEKVFFKDHNKNKEFGN